MLKTKGLLFARWTFLVVFLMTELIVLTFNFDKPDLVGIGSWWAKLLRLSSYIPQWGVSGLMATLLIGGDRLRDEMRRTIEHLDQIHKPWWPFFLGHLVAFTVFALLTNMVCREEVQQYAHVDLLVASWVAAGLAVLASWGGTVLPPTLWRQLARRVPDIYVGGAAVGIAAWLAGHLTGEWWWWYWHRQPVLWAVHQLLGLFFQDVFYRPEAFMVGFRLLPGGQSYSLGIAPFCSGYDAIGLVWVFLGTYLWRYWRRLRLPNAFLLIPLASLMIWFAIVLRLFALVLSDFIWSRGVSTSAAHSQLSWLVFNVLTFGFIIFAGRAFRLDVPAVSLNNLALMGHATLPLTPPGEGSAASSLGETPYRR